MALRNWLPAETPRTVVPAETVSGEAGSGATGSVATGSDEANSGATGSEQTELEARGGRLRRGAKALVTASGSALLVRERHADGSPFWTLPGGGVHQEESTVSAVERELAEELCCRAVVAAPVTAFPYAHTSSPGRVSVYTVHECHLLSEPTPVATEGVYDLRWASRDSLPTRTLPQVRTVVEGVLDR